MKRSRLSAISIILITIMLLTVGCNDKNGDMAQKQLSDFLDGYKQKNEAISKDLLGSSDTDIMMFNGISGYFADKLEYDIKSCKKNGNDNYNVKVEIETIDFEKLFSRSYHDTVEEYGDEGIEKNLLNKMEEEIKKGNYEMYMATCNVTLKKVDDRFKIQMDSSLANALTGGMNEYLNSLQNKQ